MASSIVKRYAKAILEIASETKKMDAWGKDFKNAEEIILDEDLNSFLSSPQVPFAEKFKSIDTLMKNYEPLFLNFIKVLINRNHVDLFKHIMSEFYDQNQILKGKVSATITSSIKLSNDQKKMLIEKICNIFNVTDVEIIENIDESILGGFIIRVGDTIIDSSTKNKLNELEKHLLKSTLVN
ncbi:MAG: ATP synthase F1 subunit delta [Dehalococcoidales bacterium]|jgi:F-type H+-transporting ATPase subunit delta|nr:ATP synthase F1 subunit delta [Dehalococcoidia bacterium]NCG35006.1 ATP synthase F1 subunit delta [Dehalococcoidales bacterium]